MWNPCENPILLSGIAFIVLAFLVLFTDLQGWKKLLITLAILGSAFGVDWLINTDREQLMGIIDDCKTAAVNQQPNAIASHIAQDYNDSFHSSKAAIVKRCNDILSRPLVSKVNIPVIELVIEEKEATATIKAITILDERSPYSTFGDIVPVKLKISFEKDSDWEISQVEILEVLKKSFNWRMVQ